MKISFSDSAISDLESIEKYYSHIDAPYVANKYINNIITKVELLSNNPDMGRKVPEFNVEDIRELIHNPYRIVYLREQHRITVIRIWRSERLLNLDDTPAESKT